MNTDDTDSNEATARSVLIRVIRGRFCIQCNSQDESFVPLKSSKDLCYSVIRWGRAPLNAPTLPKVNGLATAV
jgi:hypothetical protein